MTKSVTDKDSKTKKSKAEEEAETKALEAELEPKYIMERFYSLRPTHDSYCVLIIGVNMMLYYFLPGARYSACACSAFQVMCFSMSHYIVRYKGTEHEEYGKKLFTSVIDVSLVLHEILQVRDDSLASEEGRNAHASMVILTKYLLIGIIFRLSDNPRTKSIPWADFLALPAISLMKPRFGIFQPRYEALAFFIAMFLSFVIASVIDGLSWSHYVQMHKKELEIQKKTRELSKESRKREMAMEVLESYNDTSSFFEIRR